MNQVVTAVCAQVSDVLVPSTYVIHPSKGQSYPVLFLSADRHDPVPRIALFPGWEDNNRSERRRLDYQRQSSLLQRIHDAGLPGELPENLELPSASLPSGVLVLPIAAAVPEVEGMIADLYLRLGDLLRITITRVPQPKERPYLPVVSCYALAEEPRPRIVWVPGWASPGEQNPLDMSRMDRLLARLPGLPEIPAEALFAVDAR